MAAEYRIVQVRLTIAEHELLKIHARPNISSWLRERIRALPGGNDLPPLDKPPVDVGEAPPWAARAVIVGDRPGNPTLQVAAFVAAVSAVPPRQLTWSRWRPIHELYEGLRQVLSRGHGLRPICKEATVWEGRGRRPHANQALFDALFKFWDFKREARGWWEQEYKISNAKRLKAKAKDPEAYLAKQRARQRKYRERVKGSAEARERALIQDAKFNEFMSNHVTRYEPAES